MFSLLLDTWTFYKNHFVALCCLILPLTLPLDLLADLTVATDPDVPLTAYDWAVLLAPIAVYPIYQGALLLYMASVIQGSRPSVGACLYGALPFWLNLLVTQLMVLTMVGFGLMLFIVPGVLLMARLVFADIHCVLHSTMPTNSLEQSWQQTKTHFLTILYGYLLLGALIYLPSYLVLSWYQDTQTPTLLFSAVSSVTGALLSPIATIFAFRVFCLQEENNTNGL